MDKKLILAICLLVSPCLGFYAYRKKIPNGEIIPHPCKPNYMWSGVGHLQVNGEGENNQFGKDFKEAGATWTKELCEKDSDGDGISNGEELGDPDCEWTVGSIPKRIKNLSHPGVCTPFGEGICAGKDTYVNCEIQVVRDCPVKKNEDVKYFDIRFGEIAVPPTETNYYCQIFDVPFKEEDYHIVADNAVIDNHNVVHHILLYGCPDHYVSKPTDSSPNQCYMGGDATSCTILIGFWAVGYPGACYGENLGYRIGKTGFKKLKLEVHLNNPEKVKGYTDTSGMRLYYQPAKPHVQNLATVVVGQMIFEIPPGKDNVEVSAGCPSHCSRAMMTQPLYLLSAINHMHYMGRSQRTEIRRNGQMVSVIADDPRYNYDSPTPYDQSTPLKILPGDDISTTCLYSSMSRKRYVYFGDGTFDEMCFSFLTVYPAEAMPYSKWCISYGPLSTCEHRAKSPKYNCDWAKFVNLSNHEMMMHYLNLESNCNINGVCRPECKKVVDELMQHPCLKDKEMERLVTNYLETYKEGARFLGRLHSCSMKNEGVQNEVDCDASCPRKTDTCPNPDLDSGGSMREPMNYMLALTLILSSLTLFTRSVLN